MGDPIAQNVRCVRREFELRAQNLSFDAIHTQIIREGLVPIHPNGEQKEYKRSGIEKRLKNLFYRGKFGWDEEIYEGKHELIIPNDILKAVDATFGLKSAYGRRLDDINAVFAGGWLRCECGCQVTFDPKNKRNKTSGTVRTYNYYHCSNGKKQHKRQLNLSEDKIWNQFEAALDSICLPEPLLKSISAAFNECAEAEKNKIQADLQAVQGEIDQLQAKQDVIFELFANNEIEKEEYQRQTGILKQTRNDLNVKKEKLESAIKGKLLENANSTFELCKDAKRLWKSRNPMERRQLLDLILSNRSLDGLNVRFNLKKPFELLREMSRKTNWRSQGEQGS